MKDLLDNIFGIFAGPFFVLFGGVVIYFTLSLLGYDIKPILSFAIALSPIWLPVALFYLTFEKWMEYVHKKFSISTGRTTLRLHLPQEVFKSPEAMESVIAQIHNVNSPDNLWQTYIDGKRPLGYSFELVSYGGDVRFYVNVPTKKTRNAVEAQLYAQYPGIEIVEEAVDYTAEITADLDKYEMMAFHMGKKEDEVFPIKTWIDFGLDKMPKEEEKFDPISTMLEQLSTAAPHERIWVQILALPHAKKNFKSGSLTTQSTWEGKVKKKIDEMLMRDVGRATDDDETAAMPRLTTGERDVITAMERNAGKYAYETAIRWMYITKPGKFNGDFIGPMIRSFSIYDIIGRNGIGVRWRTDFDYNWFSDFSGRRKKQLKKEELMAYKKREYDHRDKKGGADKRKIFSSEELATMFHVPGQTVATPGLARVPSAKREAPPNLPIKQS
ncbi:MAG: hypothetical protein KDD03_11105 [Gelidibacter sp.]|nr:hypothetical protein [Gelidibacter sp.]